jgi:hypothetical protein
MATKQAAQDKHLYNELDLDWLAKTSSGFAAV